MNIDAIRKTIPCLEQTLYFNSGGSAPSPLSVVEAVASFLRRQTEEGPFTPPLLHEGMRIEAELRSAIARAIGAGEHEIALCSNTTEGIDLVAQGIDWREGDEVLITDQEHISGLLPWLYCARRYGIVVRVASLPASGEGVTEAIAAAMTPRTRLLSISHVSWCTGLVLPVEEITAAAHQHGAAVLLDGAQGPGQLPVDVRAIGCDFYALPGQKWLMGPHGSGGFFASEHAAASLHPSRLGWASGPAASFGGEFTLHQDARRFESATLNQGVMAGFLEALRLYQEHDPTAVWQRIRSLATSLRDRLQRLAGVEIVSPANPARSGGLLVVRVSGQDPGAIVNRLWEQHRLACRVVDPGAIRFSVHLFNTEEELEKVAAALRS